MANANVKNIRGAAESVVQNSKERYGVKIDGQWYDGFGTLPVVKGDEVEIDYEERNGFRNIKKIVGPGPDSSSETVAVEQDRDAVIARHVALKCAVQLPKATSPGAAMSIAEKFQKWLLDPQAVADQEGD